MTLVGKIFTVLILVMSIAFMMLAVTVFATHRNWRDMVIAPGGLKTQIEQVDATNKRLRAELERMQGQIALEQASRRFALGALQSRLTEAEQQRDNSVAEFAKLFADHEILVETLNTNGINLQKMTEEVALVREQIRQAEDDRNHKFSDVVRLHDELSALQGKREKLLERQEQLLDQVGRMQGVLARNELDEFTPLDNIPPPVDGIVVEVGRRDLIEISIGSDDGLRKGHRLEVFRNNAYLGRIVVVETEPDQAVGRVLPEYRKGIIKKGDRVATKLT